MIALPIDPFIAAIVEAARRRRAVVVTASPGAGKTTRIPPALAEDGPVILLQPRRVAARAIAHRIAEERGWTLGDEVGWQVRFDRRFGPRTLVLVVTEGVLAARLQQDPLLSGFRTIVLDEFHERTIYADLAIALARQAWRARTDLRLIVMSATLDSDSVAAFLDDCPVVDVPGRLHPLEIAYVPNEPVAAAALTLLDRTPGDVLCFLPGASEIRRVVSDLEGRGAHEGVEVVPLHGSLDSSEQDRVLRPSTRNRRRIVVATNLAETSVTVPNVTAVVDSGLHKVARYDAERGIDSLSVERITQDAADQRAGRAGRIGPGTVRRLWDAGDRLRPHREPEIQRIDLSATALDVIAWGGNPLTLEWFEAPRGEAIAAALTLIERLGVVEAGRLTDLGRTVQRLPLHPRLARMLVEGRADLSLIRACALLSERHFLRAGSASTSSDLLSAVDRWADVPPHVQRVALEVERIAVAAGITQAGPGGLAAAPIDEISFRRATFAGYPDRVAQRREPGSPRVKLASGAGGVLDPQSGVRDGEFIVAIEVQAENVTRQSARTPQAGGSGQPKDRSAAADNRIRIASRVEREWLEPNATEVAHRFEREAGTVRAVSIERYDALILSERPVSADPEIAAALLCEAWLARGPQGDDVQLLRRLSFAGQAVDIGAAIRTAAYGVRSLSQIELARSLSPEVLLRLARDAPDSVVVPSGRSVPLEYGNDGSVTAAVKLQELFGLRDTPLIGPRQEPVRFALLAPNGRPVQVTRDLRSFWERTYPEVRKELRGRYPRHPWPEDPWSATPTARTTRRPKT